MTSLCPAEQRLEVGLQILRILLRRLTIHSRRPALADSPVCLVHPLDVDVMRQRAEWHARHLLR